MKKSFLFYLFVFATALVQAQITFDALSLSPAYPKQSQKLNFSFNSKMSPLINEKNADIAIYQFTSTGMKVLESVLKKNGSIYTGTIMLDSNATALAFGISNGEVKDNNKMKGYIVPVYTIKNEPVKGYYNSAAQLQSGYGEYLFGIANDPKKGFEIMETGLKANKDLMNDPQFLNAYLSSLNSVYKKESQPYILAKLSQFEGKKTLAETDYNTLSSWYGSIKMKGKADSLTAVMKTKYPSGNWKTNEMSFRLNREKDAAKKVLIYDSLMAGITPEKKNSDMINTWKGWIADAYTKEKNTAMFTKWSNELPMTQRAGMYNNISWNLAEKNENLAEAKRLSEIATMWAKAQVTNPTEKQPEYLTKKQWLAQRADNYAMFADTYALILYNLGDYKNGLTYAKYGAENSKLKDPDYNERYAMLLEKVATVPEAKPIIESMVISGKATPKTKDALKALYVKEYKNETGFDQYILKLEESAAAQKRADLAKSMINTPTPKFALKDWAGNEVSLESLKGKVVIVDFWATWCGPCIASMPGMKKAQEKLAGRNDVKFLFVDTWENADNKLTNSQEFMKKKGYDFYVLMDNESKMVEDFGVSGIPTKFILDKNGNTRFKSVGFEGSTDALAEEVMTMIEMAGK